MSELAILGGTPVISTPLVPYNSIGDDELAAVTRVIRSGRLSGFLASWGPEFYGGPENQMFEHAWAAKLGVKHAVAVNSNTSGLIAAIGAIGTSPGDEVIVPPLTMSATAAAPLMYGAIPVFADVEPDTFCLDVEQVKQQITSRTKAILAVSLFGHPAPLHALRALADERRLYLIEDNAQAPLASENGRWTGTIGHIGVSSLNFHKHVHTGEGGVCTSDDDELALRLRLIRNHAENCVEAAGVTDLTNMVGYNFRMTELCAAVGLEQLKAMDRHVGRRRALADDLNAGLFDLPGLRVPVTRPGCSHVYYMYQLRFDASIIGVRRETFARALTAEGFPNFRCYPPLHRLPVFRTRTAFGRSGYPFTLTEREYGEGLCPVAERMHDVELIGFDSCGLDISKTQVSLLVEAVRKVHAKRHELMSLERPESVPA